MNNKTAIQVLNSLLIIHQERLERYNLASKKISNYTLKKAFDIFQQTSLKFKLELSKEVLDIGGTPIEYSKRSKFIKKYWFMLRTIFNYQGESALITSCANNDLKFMKKYYDTITYYSNSLSDDQKIMLSEQYFSINNEQHHINSFKRDN
jgi:hypothetical protein